MYVLSDMSHVLDKITDQGRWYRCTLNGNNDYALNAMMMMIIIYPMIVMTTDDTGARYDDRAMFVLSDMSHVLDRITDRKVGGIDALSMGTMMMPCMS